MSKKSKAQNNRKHKTIQSPKQSPKCVIDKLKSIWKRIKEWASLSWQMIWRFFVVFSVLLGVVAILYPRPMVSPPTAPLDSNDPFSVSFDIFNDGFLPLYDCGALIGLGQMGTAGTHQNKLAIYDYKERLTKEFWLHHKLNMDERFTIVFSDFSFKGFEFADIAIVVSYKPWFLPIRMEKLFRFVTFKQRDGKTYWRSWPLNEPLSWIPN